MSSVLLAGHPAGAGLDTVPGDARVPTLPAYDLVVRVLPESAELLVRGTLTLPPEDRQRDYVRLALSELMGDLAIDVLSPVASAGRAAVDSERRPGPRSGWGTVTWTIRPTHAIPAGAPLVLRLHYRGGGLRTSEIFAIRRECAFAGGIKTAWYPELEEEPRPPGGELRGLRGIGFLEFEVPPGFVVYAPGATADDTVQERAGRYRFRFANPIYFSFAAARYTVVHRAGTVAVDGYTLRPRPDMPGYLDRAARVLGALVDEFGPLPRPRFAIAEVPAAEADSAGFDGASLEGLVLASTPYLERPFNTAYFGHEVSHQWWPNLVASKTVGGARTMLSEGLAQYGSLRAVAALEGEAAAERYRRTGYPGFNDGLITYSALSYLRLAAAGEDGILSDLPADVSLQRALVLTKGFLVWDMLSHVAGRERFRMALHEITRVYAFRRIGWQQFLAVVQRHAGRDLSEFCAQWFDRPGAPEYRLQWRQQSGGILEITLTQPPPTYAATLEIEARGVGARRDSWRVPVRGERTAVSRRIAFPVVQVVLDPHFRVLRWAEGDRADATALAPYTRIVMLLDAGRAGDAERDLQHALATREGVDSAGLRFSLHYAYAQLLTARQDYRQALQQVRAALAEPVRRADVLPLVFGQLALLAYDTKDSALLRAAADSAMIADSAIGNLTGAGDDARRLVRRAALRIPG